MTSKLDEVLRKYHLPPLQKRKPPLTRAPRTSPSPVTHPIAVEPSRISSVQTRRSASVVVQPRRPADEPSPRKGRRNVEGLDWTTIEGITVLRGRGKFSNYVACPSEPPKGNYEILRLKPRALFQNRVKSSEILRHIESRVRQEEEIAERKRQYQQEQIENELRETIRLENQPGFYVLPGEQDYDDPRKMVPVGPFWKFDLAGTKYSPEDRGTHDVKDDDAEDWAVELLRSLRAEGDDAPVEIIEARNSMNAKDRKGHIWWKNGLFKGPPDDPRQIKLRW